MKFILCSISILCCTLSFSQAPSVAWQKLIGGVNYESGNYNFLLDNDSLYLTSSSQSGISGDKTQICRGGDDYWLVKTDMDGNVVWDKTMGAGPVVFLGPLSDEITSIKKTSDGSLLVAGFSESSISGEKTEVSRGDFDYWLLKLSATGTILWDKTLGGDDFDKPIDFFETADGNYIVAGTSLSSATGDKTEVSRGGSDLWIIKMTPAGTVLWQKVIGGSGYDSLSSIIPTPDNGFIISSSSNSSISGDKTENSYGSYDIWVIKLDADFNIQWQKTIGGSLSDYPANISQTQDGGYIIGGNSESGISGLKTESNRGQSDYWVLKLDSAGAIEWQKTIGGSSNDNLSSVYQCLDGSYIIVGGTSSNISGDKTEDMKGVYDGWIVKLDAAGVLKWQKDIGGDASDNLWWITQLPDASFLLGGYSASSNSFDVTATNHGNWDIWLLKLNAEDLSTNQFDTANVAFYPNPVKDVLNVSLKGNTVVKSLYIYNVLGQLLQTCTNPSETIDVSGLKAGSYLVKIVSDKGTASSKFIKE